VLGGGTPPGGVVSAPPYGSISSASDGVGTSFETSAVEFVVSPDGVWAGGEADSSVHQASGNWYLPATADVGADYEVRFTPTQTSGSSSVIVNDAGSWISLSAERKIKLTLSRHTVGVSESRYTVKVEIRNSGGDIVSSGSMNVFLHTAAHGDDTPE
jgi:hypothetical protein